MLAVQHELPTLAVEDGQLLADLGINLGEG